ncbi:MAG TPA: hypothetical protein VD838_04210 [Anaeromyxobacteraceae bacterium]|nr:hypothetical protein [Anaeromyxobacteraceae bacterium]
MTARRAGLLVAAALVLGACGLAQKVQQRIQARPVGAEWVRLRDAATRQVTLYDGFLHRATATATFLSPAVREARARQLAVWLSWSPEELERQLAAERADAEQYDDFVVSFFAADFVSNDLDAPRSVWRMAVEVPEAEVLPVRVTTVDRDATILTLYPWVGRFDTVYVMRFPRAPGAPLMERPFVLMIASAMGQLALDYGTPPGTVRLPDQAP